MVAINSLSCYEPASMHSMPVNAAYKESIIFAAINAISALAELIIVCILSC